MNKEEINILVVDDEEDIRNLLYDLLTDRGHNVTTVPDGFEALARVKANSYVLIFVDLKMPGMNGLQTFRAIKEINPEVAVVFITGYGYKKHFIDLVKEGMEEGVLACLKKPFEIKEIIAIVDNIVGKTR